MSAFGAHVIYVLESSGIVCGSLAGLAGLARDWDDWRGTTTPRS
jgi:hypothetical protein